MLSSLEPCRHGIHYTCLIRHLSHGSVWFRSALALSSLSSSKFSLTSHSPLILGLIMSSDGRSRRRELVEEAYNLQVKAGLMASRIPFWILQYYDFVDPSLFSLSGTISSSTAVTCYHTLSLFIHLHIILYYIIFFQLTLTPHDDRAQRNMALSDSAQRFSPTVPGPISSQFSFLPSLCRRPKKAKC